MAHYAVPLGFDPAASLLDLGLTVGHMAAADHLFALDYLLRNDKLKPGDLVMLIGEGVGLSGPFWQSFGTVLEKVLEDAGDGPVLDIGAGTGMGLTRTAARLPRHDIIAVEPSAALRTGLFARLSEDPALAARTTVLPVTVQEAVLPSPVGAVTGINMLGHLPPADRAALWERLAAALSPGAPAVFTLQPPARPERIAELPFGEAVAGTWRYSGPSTPTSSRTNSAAAAWKPASLTTCSSHAAREPRRTSPGSGIPCPWCCGRSTN